MALTEDFTGGDLPADWTFEAPNGGTYDVAKSTVLISLPQGVVADTVFNTSSPDESTGVVHSIPDHGGDIDIAVQINTDFTDRLGWAVNLLALDDTADGAARAAWYHNASATADTPTNFGYVRAGGSGGNMFSGVGVRDYMTGNAGWMRLQYVASTGTWTGMDSADGVNWRVLGSRVRAFTATQFKFGLTNSEGNGMTIALDQVIDVIDFGSEDLRAPVPERYPVHVVSFTPGQSTLPSVMVDESSNGSVTWTGSVWRMTYDPTVQAARSRISYTGPGYPEWGFLVGVTNPVRDSSSYFVPGAVVPHPGGIDQYAAGHGYALEVQSGSVRRAIRVDDPRDSQINNQNPFSGLDEVPYTALSELNTFTPSETTIRWFRFERIGRRFRIKEWEGAEPAEWNIFDGQDEFNLEELVPGFSLGRNVADPAGTAAVFDIHDFEFYRLVDSPPFTVRQGISDIPVRISLMQNGAEAGVLVSVIHNGLEVAM